MPLLDNNLSKTISEEIWSSSTDIQILDFLHNYKKE